MKTKNILVVGFNGSVEGFAGSPPTDCSKFAPIAKYADGDAYFFLSDLGQQGVPKRTYRESEIERQRQRGNLTLLRDPLPAAPTGIVVCVSATFLKALGHTRPKQLLRDYEWSELSHPEDGPSEGETKPRKRPGVRIWAACLSEEQGGVYLHRWASMLLEKSQAKLAEFFSSGAEEEFRVEAEHLSKLALQATPNNGQRADIYVCYGAAVRQSDSLHRLRKVFDKLIEPQTAMDWDDFNAKVQGLSDTIIKRIADRVAAKKALGEEPQAAREEPQLIVQRFIAALRRSQDRIHLVTSPNQELHNLIEAIGEIKDDDLRFQESEKVAAECRRAFPVSEKEVANVIDTLRGKMGYKLEANELKVICGSPVLYYQRTYEPRRNEEKPIFQLYTDNSPSSAVLHYNGFYQAARELQKKGVEAFQDPFTYQVLARERRSA